MKEGRKEGKKEKHMAVTLGCSWYREEDGQKNH
jgi:hypothetical protein